MNNVTLEEFKKFCKGHTALAIAVCKAQAYAEIKREQVDAYVLPIFQKYTFPVTFTEMRAEYGENVKSPKDLYLTDLDSEAVKNFYKDIHEEHRKHGFNGPFGHCPALIAEKLLMEAEKCLLEAFQAFFGIEEIGVYGEDRKKFLKLALGASLKGAKE